MAGKKPPDPGKKAQLALKRAMKKYKMDSSVIGKASELDLEYEKMPTPFPAVNMITGGGFPVGKTTCVTGPSQSGKTCLAAQTLAYNQTLNPELVCLWVDAENSWDSKWMEKLGVDIDRVFVVQLIGDLEDSLNIVIDIIKEAAVDMIVYDSIGALASRAEFSTKGGKERGVDDDDVGLIARKMSKFFRMVTQTLGKSKCVNIMIGQVYTTPTQYGGIDTVKGGNAFKHHTHLRLLTRRTKDEAKKLTVTMPDGEKRTVVTGWKQQIKVDKTKQSATEGYAVTVPFSTGTGLVAAESCILSALQMGLVEQKGAWYYWKEEKFQGKNNAMQFFMDNDKEYEELIILLNQITIEDLIAGATGGSDAEVEEEQEFDPDYDLDEE